MSKSNISPSVSFIVTARNEELRIREKLDNTLQQVYPPDKLEIIVASDSSTDSTDEIVRSYEPDGIRLVRTSENKGKEAAQKLAVEIATGEILVFSDLSTILSKDGLSNIVKNFHDPSVGCVSSVDRLIDADGRVSGEGAYVRYEMLLRKLETKVNTLVGLSGSFFAARREVCQNWATDLQSDFNTLLNTVKVGLRGVSDPQSIGYYRNIIDESKEFDRKVRTVLRGISVFMNSISMLNPLRYSLFAWQLFSHKLCRWLVPFAMLLIFVSNAFLVPRSIFYLMAFNLQLLFYLIAAGGMLTNWFSKIRFLNIPSYFVITNYSIISAWFKYARGERITSYQPSQR